MKKIIVKLLFVLVIASTVLGIASCGDDGELKSYSEAGLNFKLPKKMDKFEVEWAAVCYGDHDNIEENPLFFIYYYSRESLSTELYLDKDITVSEYADWFINANSYTKVKKTLNDDKTVITLKYIYEDEGDYYVDYIMRNEAVLAHVTMSCRAEYREKYDPIFTEWMSYIAFAD